MMMTKEIGIPLYDELANRINKILPGPGSSRRESSDLRRARQSAFEKFRELGFPSIKNEDWRYTNIARFLKDEFILDGWEPANGLPAGAYPDAAFLEKNTIKSLDCYQVVLVNGS